MTLGDVSPQYREVENYYVHQVNLMESELVNIDLKNNPEQKKMLVSRNERHGFCLCSASERT